MDLGGRNGSRGRERRSDEGSGSSSDEAESDMEWEEVPAASTSQLPVAGDATSSATPATATAQDAASTNGDAGIQVTLKPSAVSNSLLRNVKGKGKNGRPSGFSIEAALQRAYLQDLHKVHTSALLISGHVRNGWMNDKTLQARLMSRVPLSVQVPFHNYSKSTHPKPTDRSRLFESAMRGLLNWWSDKFYIEDARLRSLESGTSASVKGLAELLALPCSLSTQDYSDMQALLAELSPRDKVRLLMPFAEDAQLQELVEAFPLRPTSPFKAGSPPKAPLPSSKVPKPKLPKPYSAELGELIRNSQSLSKRAVKLSGTKDISVQLFTSLCRALDIPARLVCSLPGVDYRSKNKMKSDEKIGDIRSGGGGKGKKRKRNGPGTGTGTNGDTSASVSFEDEDDDEEEDDSDGDFEEVVIPNSMPSKALKTGANGKLGVAGNASDASAAGSSKSNGRMRNAARRGPKKAVGDSAVTSPFPASAAKGKARAPPIENDEPPVPGVPTFWTEVYNRSNQEWITVDVIRSKLRPRKGEMDNGRLFYVVAYEVDQYMKDVTPRYARSYSGRTLKMRISKKRKDEVDWWEELLRPWQRPFTLGREMKEDEELEKMQDTEPMPTVLEGFKNHPRYILERHLKREEVIPPKTRQLGLFRGEPVFPRTSVVEVKSSETWMREGRKIAQSEQPLKLVKQRAVTINKRRMQEMAEQEGMEPIMQGLYSRKQTELVIPPPIVDGKIPKNSYGNLDLFAPHMLPKGAVHLPFKGVKKVAKDLGIDFAEAITGFEFHKRRAVPTVNGIIIASENEDFVLEAYYASETIAVEKEMQKRKERCLKRWKKLIVGLRVRSRIQGEYKGKDKDKGKTVSSSTSTGATNGTGLKNDDGEGVSQFQPLDEDDRTHHSGKKIATQPPDTSATQGGFIHLNELDPTIPGGAAFPVLPQSSTALSADSDNADSKLDFSSLKLPPMPIPAPAPKQTYREVNMDTQVGLPKNLAPDGQGQQLDLDAFTLADPEELAEGGVDINEDEKEPGYAGGGGFMKEEDEAEEEDLRKKDFAKHASPDDYHGLGQDSDDVDEEEMVNAMPEEEKKPRTRRNGRQKREDSVENTQTDDSVTGSGTEEGERDGEEDEQEDGSEDYEEPTPSPPPSKSNKVSKRSTRSNGTRSPTQTSASKRSTRGKDKAKTTTTPAASTRRSTRSSGKASEAQPPSSSTRNSRVTRRSGGTDTAVDSETNGRTGSASKRPTRAAAQRSRAKNVAEQISSDENEEEESDVD